MKVEKVIITWDNDGVTHKRAFLFGGYSQTLEHYMQMVAIAKHDYPQLKDEDIDVSKVRKSIDRNRFSVISFSVDTLELHPDYTVSTRFDFEYYF